ncbi:MAG: hypothetical protein AAGD92_16985 [Pseudomonadota bacterium]
MSVCMCVWPVALPQRLAAELGPEAAAAAQIDPPAPTLLTHHLNTVQTERA